MSKVVVTGATGFVGSNLVKYLLKKGFKIAVIVREDSNFSNLDEVINDIEIFNYNNNIENLILFFKIYKPGVVFHLASNFIAEHEPNQIENLIQSNITFGLHILEAMKESGVQRLINTGTSWQHYNNEDYNPVCLYAATKQAFESLIEYYVKAEDFQVITLKLFDTYGETDTRPKLINLLHKFADEQTELKMSLGEQQLNLVHIEDVCEAFYIAYQNLTANYNDVGHRVFAIADTESHSLKQVIELFESISGKEIRVNWGGRPYRKREVMNLWQTGELLPGWSGKINLEEGLKRFIIQ